MQDVQPALVVYGSLAPGEPNHWVLSRVNGEWREGSVNGYLFEITWGPAEGYQGFIPDPAAGLVRVWVLTSIELDKKWREIDDFEGEGYDRVAIQVHLDDGTSIDAQIYVARTDVE